MNWAGGFLALLATVIVGRDLYQYADEIDYASFSPLFTITLVVLCIVYGGASLMLARAWWHLLNAAGVEAPWFQSLSIYGISQLGKYVPGNVAQVLGRQAMAQGAGYDGLAVARTAVFEVVLLCAAAIVIGMIAAPVILPGWPVWGGLGLATALYGMLWFLVGNLWGHHTRLAFGWLTGFLAITGVTFLVLLVLSTEVTASAIPIVHGAYVGAWLIGYVAPGAPAGIGVREVAVTWLLGDLTTPAILTFTVVLARVVSIIGDALFFLVGLVCRFYPGEVLQDGEVNNSERE